MVAFKENSLNRHTCSSAEIGSVSVSEQQYTLTLFFITAPLKLLSRSSRTTNMLPESKILVSLILSINPLHAGQNHLLIPVRFSEERYLTRDKEMDLACGKGIISSFTSSMLQQSQVSPVVEVLTDVARILLAIVE